MVSTEQDGGLISEAELDKDAEMSLMDHLRELRRRLLSSLAVLVLFTIAAFVFHEHIFHLVTLPLKDMGDIQLQVLSPVEMFVTYLKLAALAAVFATMPWILVQIWLFVAPGLYKRERRWLAPFAILGSLFFIAGGAFAYFVVLPTAFPQLAAMNPDEVLANYRVSEYVSFVILLLLAFGFVFELPLGMWILAVAGLVSPAAFSKGRGIFVVVATVVGALLTPPDPITQVMMAVPLILFFELGIIGAKILYPTNDENEPAKQSA